MHIICLFMVELRNIKNIIFDLGGVILDIDPSRTVEAFNDIGFTNLGATGSVFTQNDLLDRLELGQISPDVFRLEIKNAVNNSLTDEQINNAWNKLLMEFNEDRISLLQKLKPRFKLFLLSNTNQIHYDFYNRCFRNQFAFNFSVLFTKSYYSFKLNLRKPNEIIYKRVLQENNLIPAETLFIDDSKINTDAAAKLGIKSYWLSEGKTITSIGLL